jgi:2-hydroxychromene-2-carboxylate isomerase
MLIAAATFLKPDGNSSMRLSCFPRIEAYKEATDEARNLDVFGSPTFVVAGEVFWGDDRLEDAVRWAKKGTL